MHALLRTFDALTPPDACLFIMLVETRDRRSAKYILYFILNFYF
jgi:hypothetical protein